jgi:hypothetical protein
MNTPLAMPRKLPLRFLAFRFSSIMPTNHDDRKPHLARVTVRRCCGNGVGTKAFKHFCGDPIAISESFYSEG